MKYLQHIKSTNPTLKNFIQHVNLDIDNLNVLIKTYNKLASNDKTGPRELKTLLKKILIYKQEIESKYSDKFTSQCKSFALQIEEGLLIEIKKEFEKYGVTSLYSVLSPHDSKKQDHHFSEILSNMEPSKVKKLFKMLEKGSQLKVNHLKKLYNEDEMGYEEFNQFLKHNDISFLGGENSKNFKITPARGDPYVLRLENRMGMPKFPVNDLRKKSLKDTITPIMTERQVTKNNVTRTISTTLFCPGGDLINHSKKHQKKTKKLRKSAVNVYNQMLAILIDISKDGYAFTDMKNSNWLIDHNNKLLISDTKSFLSCEQDGTLHYTKATQHTGGVIVQTDYMNPPEFYTKIPEHKPISVDKMHAFMFGKNLYEYITQPNCNYDDFSEAINGETDLKFTHPIFVGIGGELFKEIISNTITEDDEKRFSLVDVHFQLNKIKALHLIDAIKHSIPIDYDKKRHEYIIHQTEKLNHATNSDMVIKITEELLSEKSKIKINNILQELVYLGDRENIEIQNFIKEKKDILNKLHNLEDINKLKNELKELLRLKKENINLANDLLNVVFTRKERLKLTSVDDDKLTEFSKTTNESIDKANDLETLEKLNKELKMILDQKTRNLFILNNINQYSINENDIKMKEFIDHYKNLINNTNEINKLQDIQKILNEILADQKITTEVKTVIDNYLNSKGYVTIGTKQKALKIQDEFAKISIENRGQVMNEKDPTGYNFRLALATNRVFSLLRPVKVDEQKKIDTKTASDTFIKLKGKIKDIKKDDEPTQVESKNKQNR